MSAFPNKYTGRLLYFLQASNNYFEFFFGFKCFRRRDYYFRKIKFLVGGITHFVMNGYITRHYSFCQLGGRSYSFRYRGAREFFLDKELLISSCLAN